MDGNVTENQTLNNIKGKIVVIPSVDATLTKDGQAADAKVVGDRFTEWELLNAPVDNLESESTSRPLSANQGRALNEMIANLSTDDKVVGEGIELRVTENGKLQFRYDTEVYG